MSICALTLKKFTAFFLFSKPGGKDKNSSHETHSSLVFRLGGAQHRPPCVCRSVQIPQPYFHGARRLRGRTGRRAALEKPAYFGGLRRARPALRDRFFRLERQSSEAA